MITTIVVHPPSRDIGATLPRREGKEDVRSRAAIPSGEAVTAAQTLINFDQELVCCIALCSGEEIKFPAGWLSRLREEIKYREAGGSPQWSPVFRWHR